MRLLNQIARKGNMKVIVLVFVLCGLCFAQSYTQCSANTNMPGRTINKSVLFVDCPHVGDSAYTDTGGVDLTTDYSPQELMRGLVLTVGAGNIGVILAGGGKMVIPVAVAADSSKVFLNMFQIKSILADSISTFTGRVFPIF